MSGDKATEDSTDWPISEEMLAAGVEALRGWYGEPGEASSFLRRAVEEVYRAMRTAEKPEDEKGAAG